MVKRLDARWRWTGSVLLLAVAPLAHAQNAAAIPSLTPAGSAGMWSPAPMQVHLEVRLNHARLPQLVVFELRGGRLHAGADTLRQLGFRDPGPADRLPTPLDAMPGVEVSYDAARQQVDIQVPLPLLALDVTRLGRDPDPVPMAAESAPGLLLNYDLYASDGSYGSNATATTELRAFGLGRGVFSNTAVTRRYSEPGRGWHTDSIRLDTSWELSFPGPAVTATFGDTFTGFLDWTRPVRIGGIQVGRNYGLQPYRVTAPLPEFLGEVSVPSDIELYVNGIRQYSGSAPAGPFQLGLAPGVSGAGNAQMVITDAFGRVRTLDFPFYSTQRLLARGLSDWSVGLGVVREAYGVRSFHYASEPMASGNYRRGLSDRFTLEAHGEVGDSLSNAGLGGVWLLGLGGVLGASHARSRHDADSGSQSTLGYAWSNRHFHASLDTSRTNGRYRDIASLYGLPPSRRSERAMLGHTSSALGSISLSYVRLDHPQPSEIETSRYAGLFWSTSFAGAWSVNASVNQNLDDSADRSLSLGIVVPLGPDRQASTYWQRDRGRDQLVADLSRPVPSDGGYGWRLQARTGDGAGGLAELGWQGDALRVGAGVARFDDYQHGYAQASGSLVRLGGATFAARDIHDAFALVSTGDQAGVPVMLENSLVGHTDHRGLLLVTRLNAWQRNQLSIDPMDLPADIRVGAVEQIASPADRSGTRVEFELTPVRAAVVVLHDAHGVPMPLGTRARLAGASGDAIVGYDGEAYFEHLETRNSLRVDAAGHLCSVDFDYPTTAAAGIPRIGPLRCIAGGAP
ncbi:MULTISPECIES: fimbria/pilus outer membrane usher protein [unclassified Luteimonas]